MYEQTLNEIRAALAEVTTSVRMHRTMCTKCGATKIGAAEQRDDTLLKIAHIQESINLLEAHFDELEGELDEYTQERWNHNES